MKKSFLLLLFIYCAVYSHDDSLSLDQRIARLVELEFLYTKFKNTKYLMQEVDEKTRDKLMWIRNSIIGDLAKSTPDVYASEIAALYCFPMDQKEIIIFSEASFENNARFYDFVSSEEILFND